MANHDTAAVDTGRRQWTFTGWHMLTIMLLFFGVIISVNVTMAVMAGRTWTGLVVKNSYVESQKFNDHLAAARAQESKGWRTKLSYSDGFLTFDVRNRDGQPVVISDATLFVGRPAFEQADRTLALEPAGQGRYVARVDFAPGPWALRITGTSDGQPYRRDSRLNVRAADGVGREDNS